MDKCHVAKKHGIALLCMIFALALLFDTNMPPYAAEAHEWYLIARIALRWAPPAYDTTLASLQALVRLIYNGSKGRLLIRCIDLHVSLFGDE